MKKHYGTLSAALLCISLPVFANDFEIAGKITSVNIDYMEKDGSTNLDSEKASLGKVNGFELSLRGGNFDAGKVSFINSLDFSYNVGNTDYKGSYQGGTYGDVTATTKNKLYDLAYRLGGTVPLSQQAALGATIGVGTRYWDRSLADGNDEGYYWNYWNIGAKADYWFNPKTALSATAEYQGAGNPKMHASNTGNTYNLGSTNGYKLGLHATYKITAHVSAEADYIYDVWHIGKSNTVEDWYGNAWYEPKSTTRNQYIKMGLAYRF